MANMMITAIGMIKLRKGIKLTNTKHSSETESMDYLEFIARVTSHIPDKGQVPLEGEKLRFPPSNGRSAPCLPFSSFALRPRGHTPLDPPDSFLETKQSGQHLRPLCQCPQRACPCGSREKMRKKDAEPLCPLIIEDEDPFIPSKGWAEMIKKVYEIDPLICPKCWEPCELSHLLKITKS
ncbi:hypothetical protein KGY73_10540 [bacterium]|nr:hypothetical protein [bacterium]